MQTVQHIFLIGFMGCGKTYWGRLLAEKFGLPFHDLDDLIVARTGKSIPEIFNETGEAGFREIEHEALQSVLNIPPAVIATGGGTPCFLDHMEWMNLHGTTLFLDTSSALLAQRLRQERTTRPLLRLVADHDLQQFIDKKLEERAPFYQKANITIQQQEPLDSFLTEMVVSLTEV